jgi:lipoyl(octanoyl) transferase
MGEEEGAAAQPGVLEAVWVGRAGYEQMWFWQTRRFEARRAGECNDIVALLEHPHTYTLGRRSTPDEILYDAEQRRARGISLFEVNRGGRATYHGPGQIVGYPIVALGRRYDVIGYLRSLEDALICALAEFGVEGRRDSRHTGVWVMDNKIAAIGVRITRSITMHGFALNVFTDLSMFEGIVPCGISDHWVTSIEAETGIRHSLEDIALLLGGHLARVMERKLEWVLPEVVDQALVREREAQELRLIS